MPRCWSRALPSASFRAVVHTVTWDDLAPAERVSGASEVPGVLDGTTAGVMTFLDPDTGVPLVTFTPEMIDRAWRTVEPPSVGFSEPELAPTLDRWMTSGYWAWVALAVLGVVIIGTVRSARNA